MDVSVAWRPSKGVGLSPPPPYFLAAPRPPLPLTPPAVPLPPSPPLPPPSAAAAFLCSRFLSSRAAMMRILKCASHFLFSASVGLVPFDFVPEHVY